MKTFKCGNCNVTSTDIADLSALSAREEITFLFVDDDILIMICNNCLHFKHLANGGQHWGGYVKKLVDECGLLAFKYSNSANAISKKEKTELFENIKKSNPPFFKNKKNGINLLYYSIFGYKK